MGSAGSHVDIGQGLVFVISAPSGAGKTTLVRKVMERVPGLRFSVSYTTRSRRANEREGIDYHFVSLPDFQEMVKNGEFLEWAEVLGHHYGTTLTEVQNLASQGVDLILDIDTQGAMKVMERLRESVMIFILPPSPEVLQTRLRQRGLDATDRIAFRLSRASSEVAEAHRYHYIVVNEEIDSTVEQLKAIVIAERCRQLKNTILGKKKKEWEEYHGKNYGGRLFEKSRKPV